jgi:two-component system chemotaxis sensor kinase CheA
MGQLRNGQATVTRGTIDLMLAGIDRLEQMVDLVVQGKELPDAEALARQIRSYSSATEEQPLTPIHEGIPSPPALEENGFSFRASDDNATTRIKTVLLDRLVTLSGELLTVRHNLENWSLNNQTDGTPLPLKELSLLLRQLRNEVFQARMLPFSAIAERFPRMVYDLARKSDKEIIFRILGDAIELDRGVLEQIIEPLIHLLRNAVDHGLETPAERVAFGKPPVGSLQLRVSRQADQVLLEVTDDGRGMDPARIRSKAITNGTLNEQQAEILSTEEILLLVCTPGFSTAATVTEVSGRGVGMDVVQNAIQTIGGTLAIASEPGLGSTITITLPISVAIIHALLVTCGDLLLAVPVNAVTGIREVPQHAIITKGNRPYLELEGRKVPLRSLPELFHRSRQQSARTLQTLLLTETNKLPAGLLVDNLRGQQEVFVRPLLQPLASIRGLSGSCQLGNGQIVFVVDPAVSSSPNIT